MAGAAVIAGLVLLAAAAAPAFATDHVIGDSSGWTSGVDYTTWAKGKTFSVGDNLGKLVTSLNLGNVTHMSAAAWL